MFCFEKNIDLFTTLPDITGNNQIKIFEIASINNLKNNSILFVKDLDQELFDKLIILKGCLLILAEKDIHISLGLEVNNAIIFSENPRYRYAEILNLIYDFKNTRKELYFNKELNIYTGKNVFIDSTSFVEPYSIIFSNSVIKKNSYIMSGVKIGPNVSIGDNTIIRENSVIGGFGFGMATEKDKPIIRIPHTGGVLIGNNVEIGALNTVCSGTIEPTIIEDFVKTDDHVHIAHNCLIKRETIITACSEISGSVKIGEKSWLGPNCSIINQINIENNSYIGIGACVTKPVPENTMVAGNPAKKIKEL